MPIKLKDTKVNLDELFLDPDNYRVAKNTDNHETQYDELIAKQAEILKDLKKQKLADLKDSILKNGFLTVDRIVIKKLKENEYLVIEGNRRVAALKSIMEDYYKGYIDDENIHELHDSTKAISAVLVEGSKEEVKNYSDALMGIRHVSGAKRWHGWQSAKLVNSMSENNHSLTEIGEMLGISSKDAGRRLRGYRAFQQLENDPEFGEKKETHHYSLFLEFLSPTKNGRDWLGWDDDKKKFENKKQLVRLYQAITKNVNGEYEVRNIEDARDFLTILDTENGQKLVMQTANFRSIEIENQQDNDETSLNKIVQQLTSIQIKAIELKVEHKVLLHRIRQLTNQMLEGTDE